MIRKPQVVWPYSGADSMVMSLFVYSFFHILHDAHCQYCAAWTDSLGMWVTQPGKRGAAGELQS